MVKLWRYLCKPWCWDGPVPPRAAGGLGFLLFLVTLVVAAGMLVSWLAALFLLAGMLLAVEMAGGW